MSTNPPTITTHIKVALDGTTIDLDELIDLATEARQQIDLSKSPAASPKAVMRVKFSPGYPREVNSRDMVTLVFEEA